MAKRLCVTVLDRGRGRNDQHAGDPRRVPGIVHIVEGEPGVSDSLCFLLQALGRDVVTHPDAESFFECTPPGERDVVIVDLGHCPASAAPTSSVGCSMTTTAHRRHLRATAEDHREDELRDLGRVPVLRKPLSGDVLVSVL